MKLYRYPSQLALLLSSPPEPGTGRHIWLFKVASWFKFLGADMAEVRRRLEQFARRAGWQDRFADIARDIEKLEHPGARYCRPRAEHPQCDDNARAMALRCRPIFTPSPKKGIGAKDVLPYLFRRGDWVCIGSDATHFTTQRLDDVLPVAEHMQFIVANAMRSDRGWNQKGQPSSRCLDNACAPETRKFVVIEFDGGESFDEQARLLSALHCAESPLALVVYSGGKSLHGWFNVAGLRPAQKLAAFNRGVLVGADKSLWDACKLVRMPGGLRDNGKRQDILYWEPEHA